MARWLFIFGLSVSLLNEVTTQRSVVGCFLRGLLDIQTGKCAP